MNNNTQLEPSNLNYHLTWTESGATSSGWTDTAPGSYPATDDTAAYIVAPSEYIRAYYVSLHANRFPNP